MKSIIFSNNDQMSKKRSTISYWLINEFKYDGHSNWGKNQIHFGIWIKYSNLKFNVQLSVEILISGIIWVLLHRNQNNRFINKIDNNTSNKCILKMYPLTQSTRFWFWSDFDALKSFIIFKVATFFFMISLNEFLFLLKELFQFKKFFDFDHLCDCRTFPNGRRHFIGQCI